MKSKLTLSVDRDLVQYAHAEARKEGRSISSLFSTYLRQRKAQLERQTVPTVAAMSGSLKSYNIDDSKSAVRAAYAKKYTN